MPRPVTDPRGRYSWEANFNPVLRMSHQAISSVKFKMDQERVRLRKTLHNLTWNRQMELRLTQKELEEVKTDLFDLKAFKVVAQKTAFANFDPTVLRKREKEEEQHNDSDNSEMEDNFSENDCSDTFDKDDHKNNTNNADSGRSSSFQSYAALDKKKNARDDVEGDKSVVDAEEEELEKIREQRRRMSLRGQVVVTLQDIIDNDDVLKQHSQAIASRSRRGSRQSGSSDSSENRLDTWARVSGRRGSSRIGGKSPLSQSAQDLQNMENQNEEDVDVPLMSLRSTHTPRRQSRYGSIGSILDTVIHEHTDTGDEEIVGADGDEKETKESSASLKEELKQPEATSGEVPKFKSKRKKSLIKGVFITASADRYEDMLDDEDEKNKREPEEAKKHKDKPMTLYQIQKMYKERQEEETKTATQAARNKRLAAEKTKQQKQVIQKLTIFPKGDRLKMSMSDVALSHIGKETHRDHSLESGKREVESSETRNLHPEDDSKSQVPKTWRETRLSVPTLFVGASCKNDGANNSGESESLTAENNKTCSSSDPPEPKDLTLSTPLRGLARFKNAATKVAIKNMVGNGKGVSRFKNLAAAVMVDSLAGGKGQVPKSFMFSQSLSGARGTGKENVPALEMSHRKGHIIRPLEMPESVRKAHEKKWTNMMVNIHCAVQWKARALREDTGTLNPRQVRRQMRETARPVARSVLPDRCKTTWALKRYVDKEVEEVKASWKPENLRREHNRKLIERITLPEFVDRKRTTTVILDSFKEFKINEGRKDEHEQADVEQCETSLEC